MWYVRLTCSIILDIKHFHQVSSISLFWYECSRYLCPKLLLLSNRQTLYDDAAVNSRTIYILWKKIANRTLHDILHRLYHGLLSLPNIIQFHSACTNVISFTPTRKVQPSQREFSWTHKHYQHYMQTSYSKFHSNNTINMVSKQRKCSTAQGPHSEVVPRAFWRLVSKSCDECKGSFARGCEAKRWSHWTCSSLETIFQPMRINSVPDVKCSFNNKNVLPAQSMVWHFVPHPVH